MSDKIKKLSQAIRLGATFRPQCRGTYFRYDLSGEPEASCAIGAAIEAVTGRTHGVDYGRLALRERFPEYSKDGIANMIVDWNDIEHLTREQIADKLEAQGL